MKIRRTPRTRSESDAYLGSKIGLDATDKWPPETTRAWGRKIEMDPAVVEAVTAKWARLGLPGGA